MDGEVFSTTGEHPFWGPDLGWVEAKDLIVGLLLQTADGRVVDVDRVEKREGPFEVYNFKVEGIPTYFVSELGVLVHNANCQPTLNIEFDKQGKHIPRHRNFIPGRSELTHPNPQELVNNFAGQGVPISNNGSPGQPGFKKRVDFGENIGNYVDADTKTSLPTTKGIIHYSKKGVHIVPAQP